MSDPLMDDAYVHDHGDVDDCVRALEAVHAFLHQELAETEADLIRHHLHACERCMDNFEIESTITEMIRRATPAPGAPATLAARITRMRVHRT